MAKPIDETKIRHLDPKVKVLWALNTIAFAAFIWLLMTWLAGLAFPEELLGVHSSIYPFMFLMIVGIVLIPYLVWVELRYRNYTYYIADTEMIIRKGILRVERITIPFEKVQNVNVSRSIIERVLGLATLKIETAGTNPGEAEGIIPGVSGYQAVVDEILDMVEHSHVSAAKIHEAHAETVDTSALTKELAQLREEIGKLREEKERLRNELERSKAELPKQEAPAEEEALAEPEEAPKKKETAPEMPKPLLEFEGERYKKVRSRNSSPKKPRKKGK